MKNNRIRILVIEDEKELAALTRDCIRVCYPQADVELCSNGREGMNRLNNRSYDYVFVDLSACTHGSSPEGIIGCAKMNFAYTIICTGISAIASSVSSCGQDETLLKPFEINELSEIFSRHDAQMECALKSA